MRELIIIKNKENPVCFLLIDPILWNTFNILMYITPIKRKGIKEKKYSVYKLVPHNKII